METEGKGIPPLGDRQFAGGLDRVSAFVIDGRERR